MKRDAPNELVVINCHQDSIQIDLDIESYVRSICSHLNVQFELIEITMLPKDNIAKINNEYFKHAVATDTISFNLTPNALITADIYICPEVIEENSRIYSSSFDEELKTVLIHSVLHLLGHQDDTDENYLTMKEMQEKIYHQLSA
jgi:probable rRNA maturation factor